MHWAKCWRVSPMRAVTLADKSWVTSLCCVHFPLFVLLFPPVFSPDCLYPSFLSGEVSLSIERVERCVRCRIQSRRRELGKNSGRLEMLILMWFKTLLKLTRNDCLMTQLPGATLWWESTKCDIIRINVLTYPAVSDYVFESFSTMPMVKPIFWFVLESKPSFPTHFWKELCLKIKY